MNASNHPKKQFHGEKKSSALVILKLAFPVVFHVIAGLIIFFELFAVYNYVTLTPKKIFRENYKPYELHVMRGSSDNSLLKEAYKNGNMDSVIWDFNSLKAPQPEEYLLAGIAFLENKQPLKAIETFNAMIQKNAASKTDYFQDDAEYYLAMSYLNNQEPGKAMPIFEKIYANADNPYNTNVSDWFMSNVKTSVARK